MKSGFVAIVGRPNVGKSTLLNAILKRKISIISPKPQTTRNNIQGVYNREDAQIVFVDTPGIHKPFFKLGEYMNKMAFSATRDVEATILLVDGSIRFGEGDQYLISHIKPQGHLFIVFNKIDLTNVELISELKAKYQEAFTDATLLEVSALNKLFVSDLIDNIIKVLPEGPKYFPDDQVSNRSDSFIIQEIIREKVLLFTRDEIPHSVAVIVEKIEMQKSKVDIYATIIVERDSQKAIVIGQGGKMAKRIGTRARGDIENLLKKRVNLELFVRVENEWRNTNRYLKEFGYDN